MPLTSVEERLFAGLADQAGLVLRGARLRAELEPAGWSSCPPRAEELRGSRQRLVDAQDAERRRLERDIHDGAQQHLVALAVNLRLAETLAGPVAGAGRRAARGAGAGGRRGHRDAGPASPAASTRGCSATKGWRPRSGRRSPAARCRSNWSPVTSAGTPPASRRRRTSAAWRRCRTPPSTRRRRRSAWICEAVPRSWGDASTTMVPGSIRRRRGRRGLANMRDRVESVGGTLDHRDDTRRGTLVAAQAAGRGSPAGGTDMYARIAWVLAALTVRARRRRRRGHRRSTGRCCPRRPSPSTGSRSSPARSLGCAVDGRADRGPVTRGTRSAGCSP